MKKIYHIATLLLVMLALNSCGDEPRWYEDDIIGHWTAEYYYDGNHFFNLAAYDVDHFTFYRGGTGRYEGYDDYGHLYYTDFDWDFFGRDQIEISFYEGGRRSYLRYYYDWDRDGYLLLSESPNFYTYIGYRYSY